MTTQNTLQALASARADWSAVKAEMNDPDIPGHVKHALYRRRGQLAKRIDDLELELAIDQEQARRSAPAIQQTR